MERATQGYQDTSVLQVIVVMTPTQISWFLPAGSYHPNLLNASVLGSVAGVQISSGSSVSCAVKPAVVFGTSRAQFQSWFPCIISMEHFGFRDWSHTSVCVCVRACVSVWFLSGGLLLEATGSHMSPECLGRLQKQRETSLRLFSCYFFPLQEVSC